MVLQASDIVLVVLSVVFFLLLIVGCVYFLVYFQHPDDKLIAWFPKVVVVVGLVVACTNVLLLPLDVGSQGSNVVREGLFPMQQLEEAFFLLAVILFFAIIPFAYLYYEGYDDDEIRQSTRAQVFRAFKWVTPFILIMAAIMTAVYWFQGFAEFNLQVYSSPLYHADSIVAPLCQGPASNTTAASCTACVKSISFRVSPAVYVIAIVNVVGFVVLVFFGGVGLAALPMDLILEFKNRPRQIKLTEYTRRKIAIGQRAENLMKEGVRIKNSREEAQRMKSGKRRYVRALDRDQKLFKQQLLVLEQDYHDLQDAYQNGGGNIIWQWAKFLFGCLGIVISFFWDLHICLYILPQVFNDAPLSPLLNAFFEACSKAPIFGPLFYGLFAFYLLLCVIKGNVKLGFRVVFIELYPLRLHDTLMNALLFNAGLLLAGSLAVVQLCTIAFSEYAKYTSINGIFYVQITHLRGISYIFDIYGFALVIVSILALAYLAAKPADLQQKAPMPATVTDKRSEKKREKERKKEDIELKKQYRDKDIKDGKVKKDDDDAEMNV